MSKKTVLLTVAIATMALGAALSGARGQDSAPAPKSTEANDTGHAYRVDFVLSEIEDARKMNSRQYALNLNAGENNQMKIGTRIPVEVKQGEIQYLDVGTALWCRLRDRGWPNFSWLGNDVMLNLSAEISNFAVPEQQAQTMRPAIRQMRIEASTIAVVGKQMVVGNVDDPNSKRQYQLEVTVTRLK